MTCASSVTNFALWALVVLAAAGAAWFVGVFRVERERGFRGQVHRDGEIILVCPLPWGLEQKRLRWRRRRMMGAGTNTEQFALDFDRTDPGLADLVRGTAKKLARERGAITSEDVWRDLAANNPIAHGRLKLRPKGINVAWTPRKDWQKTGEWRPLGSNSRPVPCWRLCEEVTV